MTKEAISFKPKQVGKTLLTALPERAQDIMRRRYGLEEGEGETLEAIGKRYGITRERVRQIEEFSLRAVRKSLAFGANLPEASRLVPRGPAIVGALALQHGSQRVGLVVE